MGLRLLGPPELDVDGRSVAIGAPRVRVVLAVLALNANRTTPVERLVDAVWDTSPPATSRAQIQICVSTLRKLFEDTGRPWAIRTRPPGYLLEIGPEDLDVTEFGRLTAQARDAARRGRASDAAATLRIALGLWRGPGLAGVDSAVVQREVALLEEQRLSALEERIRLDLELGKHRDVGGELRALVEEYPLRERLHGFLMLALYRSDRQAEALEAYRQARRHLVENAGIEPGPELHTLHCALLDRSPALDLPLRSGPDDAESAGPGASEVRAPVPRQLPASIADFTGREQHLDTIRTLLSGDQPPSAAAYAVRLVGISGPGGVGKTSLAVRAAHELAEDFPDGQLYADLRTAGADDGGRLLGRFLRALGVGGQALPDDSGERAELYRSLLAGRRLLIILDGVTRHTEVTPLLPGSPGCGVIVTSREQLGGLPGLRNIALDVLDTEQAMELLGKIVGRDRVGRERVAAAELVRHCDGLPLAVRIAGARLASRPHWQVAELVGRLADEARRLDELAHHGLELRSTIALTHQGLVERERKLFRRFALVPTPDAPAWVAAALLNTSVSEGDELLERLVEVQLMTVVEYRGTQPRFRFHDLVRVYAAEQLAQAESESDTRAALGRMLGGWMAMAETAHRKTFGGDFTTLHGTAHRWRPVDVRVDDIVGNPHRWFESERRALTAAFRQAATNNLDELCWNLALTSITLFERGHFDDWREATELALGAVRRAGNELGEAAMLHSLGAMHLSQNPLADATRYLGQSVARFRVLGNDHGVALSLRHLARVDDTRGDHAAMLDKYVAVRDLFLQAGDRIGYAQALRGIAKYQARHGGDTESARRLLDEALGIAREHHDLRTEAQVLLRIGDISTREGDFEGALESLRRAQYIVGEIGDRIGEAYMLAQTGEVHLRRQRPDDARVVLRRAIAVADLVGLPIVAASAWQGLGELAAADGDAAAAIADLDRASRLFDQLGAAHDQATALVMLAEVRLWAGEQVAAAENLDRAEALLGEIDAHDTAVRSRLTALRSRNRFDRR